MSAPHPAALYVPISAEEYRREVEGALPTLAQAQLTLTAYFALSNNFLRLIHPPTFLAQCDHYWRTGQTPEPNWLATYLIVCAYGLLAAPDTPDTANPMLPTGPGKEMLARTWFDAARRVLAANRAFRYICEACVSLAVLQLTRSHQTQILSRSTPSKACGRLLCSYSGGCLKERATPRPP
mgnify:CR=1 FL=1|jgi:hypothetical protein